MKVGVVQMRSGVSVTENLAAVSALVREAAAQGAQLVATPEGTTLLDRRASATHPGEEVATLAALRALAAEAGVWLLVGSMPVAAGDGRLANRSVLIGPAGEVIAEYDKIHMFDVTLSETESYRESARYRPGQQMVLAQAAGATIGLTVCYDLRFPALYRRLAQAGAQVLAVPSAFTRTTGQAHWHVLLRARAIETGCFVIAPAQGGTHEDGRETFGHSLIVSPWGEVVAEIDEDAPGVLVAELDLAEVARARARVPSLGLEAKYE